MHPDRLATIIRSSREAHQWTIKQAATAAGVSRHTWAKVESGGQVRSDTLSAVCTSLGWSSLEAERILRGESTQSIVESLTVRHDGEVCAVGVDQIDDKTMARTVEVLGALPPTTISTECCSVDLPDGVVAARLTHDSSTLICATRLMSTDVTMAAVCVLLPTKSRPLS